ncbi:hypothetical protein ACIQVU_19965 [Lysinibacillus sp. NPDC098008]|uniref:hypothetical protein n=1 Tax=Lysinibacillus sp. NPDC098008 TaxID=3364146 RepID=UPI00380E88B5
MDKLNDKNFYYCYDAKMSRYLTENRINYIVKAKSLKDGRIFTMYERDKTFYDVLHDYSLITKAQ